MASEKLEKFFDLENAVKDWGLMMCKKNARSFKKKKIFKRQFVDDDIVLDIEINWSHLSVSHKTEWGRITDTDFKASEPNENTAVAAKPSENLGTDVNILFETEFENKTTVNQEYTMKVEKTTKSSITTEIESGVTTGIELSAKLNVADVLEVGTGFSREVSLSKMEGETIENELTWGAESTVQVPTGKKASAEMLVLEKRQSGDFTINTTMCGYVTIKYTSLKTGLLVFGHSGKIDTIVKHFIKSKSDEGKKFSGIINFPDDSMVQFQTKGKCAFRYGIKQVVKIIQD